MNIGIIGSGGHAKVIVDLIKKGPLQSYPYQRIYIFDDVKKYISGTYYVGPISEIEYHKNYHYICAIGDLEVREKIIKKYKRLNWLTLIHNTAVIPEDIIIGEGTVIMAGCIIQPGTVMSNHCIINTKSSLDHDCSIGNNVHICPGVTLCGTVKVGSNTMIGAGTTIIQNVSIGKNNLIGAGSVVIKNKNFEKTNYIAYGNPCKIRRQK